MIIIITYLLLANAFGVFIMYSDKKKSKKGYWRVPEERLFIVALAFGSAGILSGMKLFRHKTRHWKFVYGVPLILIVQLYLLYKLFNWML